MKPGNQKGVRFRSNGKKCLISYHLEVNFTIWKQGGRLLQGIVSGMVLGLS